MTEKLIKVKIKNDIDFINHDNDGAMDPYMPDRRCLKDFDAEVWGDGKTHYFDTLQDAGIFLDSCPIKFSEEFAKSFSKWDWWELDMECEIDTSEPFTINFTIDMHDEWRD